MVAQCISLDPGSSVKTGSDSEVFGRLSLGSVEKLSGPRGYKVYHGPYGVHYLQTRQDSFFPLIFSNSMP